MKISISQVYVDPGAEFPFSFHMQRSLGQALTGAVTSAAGFERKFGEGYGLILRISAQRRISVSAINGPTVYKRAKDVEYTISLPYDAIDAKPNGIQLALGFLLDGVESTFHRSGLDPAALHASRDRLIGQMSTDPAMLSAPWPGE